MTLSDVKALQVRAEFAHRLLESERTLYIKAIKKNRSPAALAYRKGWYDKAEGMRARASAKAREALFAVL